MAKKLKDAVKQQGLTEPEFLDKFTQRIASMEEDMASARGELGSAYKNAETEKGLHRKAFKLAHTLRKMAVEKRADFLRAFDHYRDAMVLDGEQSDLFEDNPDNMERDFRDEGEIEFDSDPTTKAQAYQEGAAAGEEGASASSNKYADGTELHGAWYNGWIAGQTALVNRMPSSPEPVEPAKRRGRPPAHRVDA